MKEVIGISTTLAIAKSFLREQNSLIYHEVCISQLKYLETLLPLNYPEESIEKLSNYLGKSSHLPITSCWKQTLIDLILHCNEPYNDNYTFIFCNIQLCIFITFYYLESEIKLLIKQHVSYSLIYALSLSLENKFLEHTIL